MVRNSIELKFIKKFDFEGIRMKFDQTVGRNSIHSLKSRNDETLKCGIQRITLSSFRKLNITKEFG